MLRPEGDVEGAIRENARRMTRRDRGGDPSSARPLELDPPALEDAAARRAPPAGLLELLARAGGEPGLRARTTTQSLPAALAS